MITIEDIALEVGCSVNTVSRALNNKPDVSAITRKKVLEIAKQLGYVPNTLARSMVTKSTESIGVIVPSLRNPLYAKLVSFIEKVAQQQQQNIFVGQSGSDPMVEKMLAESYYQRRVDGLLIVPSSDNCEHLEALHSSLLPIIYVMHQVVHPSLPIPFVGCDLKEAVSRVFRHLVEQGRKKLAVINHVDNNSINKAFLDGAALYADSLECRPDILEIRTGTEVGDGYEAAMQLLRMDIAVDGIVLHNDMLAPGVMAALRERGLDCPQDVAVVGCGNMDFADYLSTPLTTIDMLPERIGGDAVELLWQLINKPEEVGAVQPSDRIVKGEVIVRASSGASYIRKEPEQRILPFSRLYAAYEG